jgi:putative CocE/NonD family hydrolase
VAVYVMGEKRWRTFPSWPPAGFTVRYFLGGMGAAKAGTLYPDNPPPTALPDRYRYDPANPTPSLGGPLLATKAGPKDNRPLEARADLLVYTSLPLSEKVTIIGPVQLELFMESSTPYTDFFGRLLDVHPDGRSINLCEGHVRLHPAPVAAEDVHEHAEGEPSGAGHVHGARQADGTLRVVIDLGATAHQFQRGHRIRLHVCSGAHPRISRNLGTGDPLHEGTRMVPADQTVHHDAAHPSALVLPLMRW